MIELRYNGKFFSDPISADTAEAAFDILVDELGRMGVRIASKKFSMTLRGAGVEPLQFMWDRAVTAEENNTHAIFCLFDHGGWRFFGRV